MTALFQTGQELLGPLLKAELTSDIIPQSLHVEDMLVEHSPQAAAGNTSRTDFTTATETRDEWFIGSIDQGTTSSRFLIFNSDGEPVASHQIEFENLYPESG